MTEVETELARIKKELVEVKMERDILKKQLRTLPRSRCAVRGDEADAASLPHTDPESDSNNPEGQSSTGYARGYLHENGNTGFTAPNHKLKKPYDWQDRFTELYATFL